MGAVKDRRPLHFARRKVSRALVGKPNLHSRVRQIYLIARWIPNIINSFWALPTALATRIARPWKVIRIGPIQGHRIGHFTADGAQQVVRYRIKQDQYLDLFYLETEGQGQTCNSQWELMLRRTLPIGPSWLRYVDYWNRKLPRASVHHRPSTRHASRDIEGLLSRFDGGIEFLESEEQEAKSWLRSRGWRDGEPFVCLLVRDSAYLTHSPLHGDGTDVSRVGWSYHDYRNSEIETYVDAIRWLNDRGVWVLRMGRIMEKPVSYQDARFIDYAFDKDRSDLLDIWLFANAKAIISTGSGLDMLGAIYGVPILMINYLPVSQLWSWCHCVTYPKTLRNATTGRTLALDEHLEADLFTSDGFRSRGIEWTDLTSTEILRSVRNFWAHDHSCREARRRASHEFWSLLKFGPSSRHHGFLHPKAQIDHDWFRKVTDEIGGCSSSGETPAHGPEHP